MKSYIVRIYRRGEDTPSQMVGVVLDMEAGQEQAFASATELWTILGHSPTGQATGQVHKTDQSGGE